MTGNRPELGIEINNPLPGPIFEGDFNVMRSIVQCLPNNGTLVEIGSLFGKSAVYWVELFRFFKKDYKIYCLDKYAMDKETASQFLYQGNVKKEKLNLIAPFLQGEMTHYEMTSNLLSKYSEIECVKYDLYSQTPAEFEFQNITCVFDDSVHDNKAVTINLNNWFPLISHNGIFCGHDYNPTNFPSLVKGVTDYCNKHMLNINTFNSSTMFSIAKTHE